MEESGFRAPTIQQFPATQFHVNLLGRP